jgi:hypothetical protein
VDGADFAALYVAKMSQDKKPPPKSWTLADEATRSGSKVGRNGSRSVWEILDTWADRLAPEADRGQAARLLREYAEVTKGTKALTWSPGLKKRFDLAEVSDEVLAEEAQDETTKLVTLLQVEDWRHVLRHRAQADVLTAAEDLGAGGVAELVQRLHDATFSRPEIEQPDNFRVTIIP